MYGLVWTSSVGPSLLSDSTPRPVTSLYVDPGGNCSLIAWLSRGFSGFLSSLAKSLLLALIHAGLGVTWLSLVTLLLGRLRAVLARPRVKQTIEALTGTVLILFGVRLALARR